jgi:hypothetical protein
MYGIWHNPFHWHQSIEQHFKFWDDDKYVALSESYLYRYLINWMWFAPQVFFYGIIIERPWQISELLQQNSLPLKMPLISLTLTSFVFMHRSVNIVMDWNRHQWRIISVSATSMYSMNLMNIGEGTKTDWGMRNQSLDVRSTTLLVRQNVGSHCA